MSEVGGRKGPRGAKWCDKSCGEGGAEMEREGGETEGWAQSRESQVIESMSYKCGFQGPGRRAFVVSGRWFALSDSGSILLSTMKQRGRDCDCEHCWPSKTGCDGKEECRGGRLMLPTLLLRMGASS